MKNQVWDSFNFSETSELFKLLRRDTESYIVDVSDKKENLDSLKIFEDAEEQIGNNLQDNKSNNDYPTEQEPENGNKTSENTEPIESIDNDSNEDILEKALSGMCKRGGFRGAVIADRDGLPIAVYNSPVNDEILAAYSTILGESLEKAATFLNQPDANNISLDINIVDKIVLRKFYINKSSYYIMVILAQNIDERAEVEILISQINSFYND